MKDNPKAIFWICGDFNLPDIDWTNDIIRPPPGNQGIQYPREMSEMFISAKSDLGLEQMVTVATREKTALICFSPIAHH